MACSPSRELVGPPVAAACQRALPLRVGIETRRGTDEVRGDGMNSCRPARPSRETRLRGRELGEPSPGAEGYSHSGQGRPED